MKALHVAASLTPEYGGPTVVVNNLTETLAKKGLEVSVFAPVKNGDEPRIEKPKGVKLNLFRENYTARLWTGYSTELARTIEQEASKFDLIHIHDIWHYPHLAAGRAAKRARKPYIVSIHGGLEPWSLKHKTLKKRIYGTLVQRKILNDAAALHAITDQEVEHIRNYRVERPVVMIPNGVDPSEFDEIHGRAMLEEHYPDLKGKQVILFLGRLHPIKGLDILASAFGQVARVREDTRLLIVGPDNDGYKAQIERILKSERVLEKTVFTGMLTGQKKLAALRDADIYVLSSYSEGFSMSILEALTCNLPVIITHQCYFPEVAEAEAGLVIDTNIDQLTESLIKLLDDEHLRKKMGENGRRLVIESYTWDKVADQMIKLYEDVLS